MILVLTKSVFYRPWIICEFVTAWRLGIPIIPVEVSGSGFRATKQNVRELLAKNVPASTMRLVSRYCPNIDMGQFVNCCLHILDQRRIVFEVGASSAAQWGTVLDLARAMLSPSLKLQEHQCHLEIIAPDPARSFVPQVQPDQDYIAYISYHHTLDNQVISRIVKMMLEEQLGPVFLDADSLFDLDSLVSHIDRSKNMLVLLSEETLKRPFVIVEIVTALRNDIPLIPVPMVKDFEFRKYVGNEKLSSELLGHFDAQAIALFRQHGIRMPEIARAINSLFNVIAQPFYSHSSESVQRAQVYEIGRRMAAAECKNVSSSSSMAFPGGLNHRGNDGSPDVFQHFARPTPTLLGPRWAKDMRIKSASV